MVLAAIALGANLGNPCAAIQSAINALGRKDNIHLLVRSSLYSSAAVGPAGQPDYINAAIMAEVSLSPLSLLDCLQKLELHYGRTRDVKHWGPRELDLDLITYGDEIIHNARLVVPHPEAYHRCFVLAPLAEIAPHLVLPGCGMVATLLAKCDTGTVRKVNARIREHG